MTLDLILTIIAVLLFGVALYARHRVLRDECKRPGYITDQPRRKK